ncbi:uncharacterized protein LOC116192167 [Punica granatum]|nr:uncharacterized protein LOC116192167 [Punica granatum]
MMNDPNQVIHAEALAIVPAKRKRGRPRKYPVLDDPNSYLGDQSPSNGGEDFHVTPGFRGLNGKKSRQVDPTNGLRDGMTGQAVSGFLESEFDGGYLLTVRVRNSDTVLRGVVFKPGRFVPVSAENDVAPNVHMIKRNDKPLQSENYGRAHGRSHSRSRERNGVAYPSVPHTAGSVALKSKLMSPAPLQAVSSVPSRGNVVPVVLQPVTSTSNGAFTPNQHASVGNQDSHHLSPPMSKETQPVALQVVHPEVQSTPAKQAPKTSDDGPRDEPNKDVSYEAETKPVISPPGMPFENLVAEVTKRIQTPSGADNAENSPAVGKSSSAMEDAVGTRDQSPRFVEPFQAMQPNPINLSHSAPKPLESERTGKMTELLQAVQENALKNQMPEQQ